MKTTRITLTAALALSMGAVAGGCASYEDADLEATADAVIAAGSLEEYGVLRFLNSAECTLSILDNAMALDSRAATQIFAHVNGADGLHGTADDDPIGSVYELDAIAWVGPATMDQILAFLQEAGRIPTMSIEGVPLTDGEAADIVAFANGGMLEELDVDAALDIRAAQAIVAHRSYGGIAAVAAVPYVGRVALEKLRDFAPAWAPVE